MEKFDVCEVLNNQRPLFQHDCESCTFLGNATDYQASHKLVDLYFCNQGGNMPTIIVRVSDEPSDYSSSNVCMSGITPASAVGMLRAACMGLISWDDVEKYNKPYLNPCRTIVI